MLIVGLAGGVASGKSHIAAIFREWGAAVIDADLLGHAVLRLDHVKREICRRFGHQLLADNGEINRQKLGQLVFEDSPLGRERLRELELVTHPEIEQRMREQLEQYRQQGYKVLMLDAPVMFKAGWDQICNRILFIDCPRSIRLQRALNRGWSEQEFSFREATQLPVEEKRRRATDVITNDGDNTTTMDQARRLWKVWTGTDDSTMHPD